MRPRRQTLLLAALGILAWGLMTWPLPRHAAHGIGAASVRHDWQQEQAPRMMIPGDHLQLLYRFWMTQDMIAGNTPIWRNVYEFNYRGDDDRQQPGFLYMPFSLVYAAFAPWTGQALAWNLVGLLSLLGTCWATFRWTRRYSGTSPGPAMLAAVCCAAFPYRIHNLLGGSPAGFAMIWVPLLLDGLDRAILDRKIRGGIQAGIALLFAAWTDMQVFAFCAILAAGWTFIAQFLLNDQPQPWRWRTLKQSIAPLVPALVLGIIAVLCVYTVKSAIDGSVHMAHGRTAEEVIKFSPRPLSLLRFWTPHAHGELVYLGVAALSFSAAGLIVCWIRRQRWRVGFLLLMLALAAVAWLSLGPRAPDHGCLFYLTRKLLPPLKMMRQPAKILCIFAPLLSLALALATRSLADRRTGALAVAAGAVILFDFTFQTRPAISLIADEQPAYRTVAESAVKQGREAHALALPLWPGDSHGSGVYTHYASLYRIRMVNGYSPVVPQHYYDNVFTPLRSMNSGYITDTQLDLLMEMQVSHILLHEDAFPEKVSPFPVAETLRAMMAHPRLRPVEKTAGRVWAFEILPEPDQDATQLPDILTKMQLFPTRDFCHRATRLNSDSAEGSEARFRRAGIVQRDGASFWLRTRGDGQLRIEHLSETDPDSGWRGRLSATDTDTWQWHSLPVTNLDGYVVGRPTVAAELGEAEIQWLLYTNGDSEHWLEQDEWQLPALWFFHAGEGDLNGSVTFTPGLDPPGGVLYGPRLPLTPGTYEAELLFHTDATADRRIATLGVNSGGEAAVRSGERCVLRFEVETSVPVVFTLFYRAQETLRVNQLVVRRLD